METLAAVLIFGFLISLIVGLVVVAGIHTHNIHKLENSGGYQLQHNRSRFQKGLTPNKFTGEYRS